MSVALATAEMFDAAEGLPRTPWFDGTRKNKPVRPGVYEVKGRWDSGLVGYAYWSGTSWSPAYLSADRAVSNLSLRANFQAKVWRGLLALDPDPDPDPDPDSCRRKYEITLTLLVETGSKEDAHGMAWGAAEHLLDTFNDDDSLISCHFDSEPLAVPGGK